MDAGQPRFTWKMAIKTEREERERERERDRDRDRDRERQTDRQTETDRELIDGETIVLGPALMRLTQLD